MKIMKAMVFLFSVTFLLSGCGGDSDRNVIILGTEATFEPFQFRDPSGEIQGFDIAISRLIAEELGAELRIEDVDFNGLIPMLQTGQIDFIAAGLTITEDRRQNVDFSIPYFQARQVVLVSADNYDVSELQDLNGMRIGVQLGTSGELIAEGDVEGATVLSFNSIFHAVADLNIGRIDAIIVDDQPGSRIVATNPNIKLLDVGIPFEEYAIAVAQGNTELLEVINRVLEDIKESGEFDRLLEIYF